MPSIDISILAFLNTFAHRSGAVDHFIGLIAHTPLFKGGMAMALLWWGWFRGEGDHLQRRQSILATLLGCMAALAVARALALAVPFRLRPVHTSVLAFQLPYGASPETLIGWSSFPSDHAALFAGLATGMLWLSRGIGGVGLGYVLIVICLPRLYLGIHYPTDILSGVLIGMAVVALAQRARIKLVITRPWLTWMRKSPGLFYACFFLFTYEMAVVFDDVREIGRFLWDILGAIIARL
jgi:undecaprenyl-diphosphatase